MMDVASDSPVNCVVENMQLYVIMCCRSDCYVNDIIDRIIMLMMLLVLLICTVGLLCSNVFELRHAVDFL